MAKKALRTIAVAYKEIEYDKIDLETTDENDLYNFEISDFILIGICGIKDIIRPEVPGAVIKCHTAGIDVKMVTGDNKITAKAIAWEVNIINEKNEHTALILEGPEFFWRIGGIVCENCKDKEKCDCVKNETEQKKPGNSDKKIRKDTILNQTEFDKIW